MVEILFKPMNHEAELLVSLQKIDKEIETHLKRKELIPLQIKELEREIDDLKKELKDLSSKIKETEKEIKKIELDIKSKEEEIQNYLAKEHMVKSNEEYRALMDQIANAKREKESLEEKEIELLYQVDELRATLGKKEEENAHKEQEIRNKIKDIQNEFAHIDDKLAILRAQRENVVKKLPGELYSQYEKIRKTKGTAVAYVVDGSCSECNAVLPLQLVIKLRSTGEIGRCENCGRILVYVPEKDN